jgi:hypothetical protein
MDVILPYNRNGKPPSPSVKIVVAFFKKNFSNFECCFPVTYGVAGSLTNVKGRDERSAVLRALDIAEASGW